MNVSLVLSSTFLQSHTSCETFILIGQRSFSWTDTNCESVAYVVLDAIPCSDISVIAEQVECLEQILPCGIFFLAIMLSSDSMKEMTVLRNSLKDYNEIDSLLTLITGKNEKPYCRFLYSGKKVNLTFLEDKPLFVSLTCYLRSPLEILPFIVRCKTENSTKFAIIDLNSNLLLEKNDIWTSTDNIYAVQLGNFDESNNDIICVNITFAPFMSCGRDVYQSISSLISKIKNQPEGVMICLQSKQTSNLVYQWIFTPTEKSVKHPSKNQWNELKELIEDATGEDIENLQIIPNSILDSLQTTVGGLNENKKKKRNNNSNNKEDDEEEEKQKKGIASAQEPLNKSEKESFFNWIIIILVAFIATLLGLFWLR